MSAVELASFRLWLQVEPLCQILHCKLHLFGLPGKRMRRKPQTMGLDDAKRQTLMMAWNRWWPFHSSASPLAGMMQVAIVPLPLDSILLHLHPCSLQSDSMDAALSPRWMKSLGWPAYLPAVVVDVGVRGWWQISLSSPWNGFDLDFEFSPSLCSLFLFRLPFAIHHDGIVHRPDCLHRPRPVLEWRIAHPHVEDQFFQL